MRESYYGWRIALTLAITETISWGILYYAFAVFIRPMELDTGWSRTELTGAFSLALLLRGAMAVPVGIWIDRHGARLLMTVASLLASALLVLWSQADDLAIFYLVWSGLGLCMAALFYEPAFTVGSLATTTAGRPSTRPRPVMTPSAGNPSAVALASWASSTKVPGSNSNPRRSRTYSLCWRASLAAPASVGPSVAARASASRRATSLIASPAARGQPTAAPGDRALSGADSEETCKWGCRRASPD